MSAHPDDAEIGAGGVLLRHADRGDELTMLVLSEGENGARLRDSRRVEERRAADLLGARLRWGGFADDAIPFDRSSVDLIERALDDTGADVLYVPAPNDSHQDHIATARAAIAAARTHARVLCYETPTTLELRPTLYVDIDATMARKLELLERHRSQVLGSRLCVVESIVATARAHAFRGRTGGRHAEAFEVVRFRWDLIDAPAATGSSAAAETSV